VSPETYRKRIWCADLRVGDAVHEVFCVARVDRRAGPGRGPAVRLTLVDRTGEVAAVVWDEIDGLTEVLIEGTYVRVQGDVGDYRGDLQLRVIGAETAPGAVDPAEFLPRGPVPPEASMAGIRALVGTVQDRWLRALLESFLDDPGFAAEFAAAPAGKRNHHAYVGGLAEHTHSIMELCALAVGHYPGVDRDLLLAGAFCHDIGKTRELAVQPGFPYTEEGELLGHIPLGFAMVRERAAAIPGFPADRLIDLGHLVLSHQGELEWGSPVQPRTLEAIVLHFLDNLDSKVATARQHLAEVESGRTGWVRPLGRTLFRRGPAEEAPPPPPASPGGGPDAPPAAGGTGGAPSLFDELD
jgi:3'-5' exoribonuclease